MYAASFTLKFTGITQRSGKSGRKQDQKISEIDSDFEVQYAEELEALEHLDDGQLNVFLIIFQCTDKTSLPSSRGDFQISL